MKFFRTLYALYVLLIFVLSFIIFIPVYFIIFLFANEKKAPHIAHTNSRVWAKFVYSFGFINLDIKGKNKINREETYVFISNHRSQLDIPLTALACKNTFRFLAKQELAKIPFFGYVIKKLYLTVNRKDRSDRTRANEKMKQSIAEGISVFIYPEGTRNRTKDPLLPFRDGAFRLAIETQVPLAILTILNAEKINSPLQPFQLNPGTIYAVWSEPVSTIGMTADDIPILNEKATEIILKNLINENKM
ncbi:MAG: lysophospholipid acyltransferase family protein [Bacteroidia bacterium]